MSLCVRDHIPLEQGLRPVADAVFTSPLDVRDHIPLEQGLRLCRTNPDGVLTLCVRDHIPLEQGLRPSTCVSSNSF